MRFLSFLLASLSLCFILHGREVCEGWYVGVGFLESFSQQKLEARNTSTHFTVKKRPDHQDALGQLFIGYGRELWRCLYLGGEVGGHFPNRTTSFDREGVTLTTGTFHNELIITDYLRGDLLPGYLLGRCFLVYARLGATYSKLELEQDANPNAPSPRFKGKGAGVSGRFGGGIRYAWTSHFGITLDYLYVPYRQSHSNWEEFSIGFKHTACSHFVGLSLLYHI